MKCSQLLSNSLFKRIGFRCSVPVVEIKGIRIEKEKPMLMSQSGFKMINGRNGIAVIQDA